MQTARVISLRKVERWMTVLPFILALGVLVFITITAIQLISFPDDGIYNYEDNGLILAVKEDSPTAGVLQQGDVIQTLEGVPFSQIRFDYNRLDKQGGDTVRLEILRDGRVIDTSFILEVPTAELAASRLVAILVALIFWAVGVLVEAFKPLGKSQPVVFLWFQTSASQRSADHPACDEPDLLGIVLHPAGLRIILGEFRIAARLQPSLSVEHQHGRPCRSLIDGKYMIRHVENTSGQSAPWMGLPWDRRKFNDTRG